MSAKEHSPYLENEDEVRQMDQHIKGLLHKTDDLSSIPGTYVGGKENKPHIVVP